MFNSLANLVIAALLVLLALPSPAAVILQYHHVDDDAPAATSVTRAQFADHLQRLAEEGFTVVSLDALLDAVRDGRGSEDLVAITFDDGYASLMDNAFEPLEARGWHGAVFITTGQVGGASMLTPAQLVELEQRGHRVLNHGREHAHAVRPLPGESEAARVARFVADLAVAQKQLAEWLSGPVPAWFAWPYGEQDAAVRAALKAKGFLGFSQDSGALSADMDWQRIPRIPVNRRYADWQSLRDKLRARALPAMGLPDDGVTADPRPLLAFTLPESWRARPLNCFVNGVAVAPVIREEDAAVQVMVRPENPLVNGRHRVNCTSPAGNDRFYWLSWLWMVNTDGRWYPES